VEIIGMVSIFNYGFSQATDAFESAGIKLISLTNYGVLIDLALQNNMVNPKELEMLLSWRENPSEWTAI